MAAWRSAPEGLRLVGGGAWAMAILGTWMLPALLGLGLALLATGLGSAFGERPGWLLGLHAAGWVLFFSPLLSWIGLIALAPLMALLLRRGRAGWLSAMAAGLLAGMLALVALSALAGGMSAILVLPFAAGAALILRGLLAWRAPAAFATGPDRPSQQR